MSKPASTPPPPPIQNDDAIPERYVDVPLGVNYSNGNLHITFATLRVDHSKDALPQYRHVTLRLIIPLAGAVDLQNTIGNMLAKLQSQGLVQQIMPGTTTRQ